jgi:DNA-directed RNA polymerase specialized sigma subunit
MTMYKNPVITIARQYGCEGHRVGEKVAELLGISQSYISRLEKKILRKLRRELEGG